MGNEVRLFLCCNYPATQLAVPDIQLRARYSGRAHSEPRIFSMFDESVIAALLLLASLASSRSGNKTQ